MALARTYSIALAGVQGRVVEIEADIENELVALLLVGLPDTALREARDRIRSAIINSHLPWPQRRITVGMSPASLPKRGSGFDVTTAVTLLALVTSVSWVRSTRDIRAVAKLPSASSHLAHMPMTGRRGGQAQRTASASVNIAR